MSGTQKKGTRVGHPRMELRAFCVGTCVERREGSSGKRGEITTGEGTEKSGEREREREKGRER